MIYENIIDKSLYIFIGWDGCYFMCKTMDSGQ